VDDGKVLSPVQLLIERDLATGVQHLARTLAPTADSIALPTIEEVGTGLTTNFLQSEHTLRNYRANCWIPELIDRSGWRGQQSEAQVVDAARHKFHSLLEQYEKPEGREEQLAALRAIIERARGELLG